MNIFKEYQVWRRLDAGSRVPGGDLGTAEGQAARALDEKLRAAQPRTSVPGDLHGDIMRNLRQANVAAAEAPGHSWSWQAGLRWGYGLAGLILIAGIAVFTLQRTPALRVPPQQVVQASVLVSEPVRTAADLQGALLAPLEEELRRVNQDITNAARMLMASVP